MVNFLIKFSNSLIKGLGTVLAFIIGILPNSPFQAVTNVSDVSSFLGTLAWFFPFGTMLAIFSSWATCIGIYYLYSIIMRWVKMIE